MNDTPLKSICKTAKAIADLLGEDCETVVHDILAKPVPTIVVIYNGHVSRRDYDSTKSIYGEDVTIADQRWKIIGDDDVFTCRIVTPEGRVIKTVSIDFIGEGYHYVLGINYDVTVVDRMNRYLSRLLQDGGYSDLNSAVFQTLNEAVERALYSIGEPPNKLSADQRKYIVRMLNGQNLFTVQKAIPFVAEKLGVSRTTIYNYLKEMGNEKGD